MLADDITEKELLALLKAVREGLKGRAIYVETRNYNDYSKYRHVFEKAGYKYEPHLNFHVDTTSEEVVIKNIHKNKKRKIRSTLKENVVVDECPSKEDLKSFYLLLSELYKNKVKTPLLPLSFFEKLYDQEFSKFLIIKKDKEVLGGQLVEHGRYDYVLSPMLYKVGKMGVKIMKSNILTDGWGGNSISLQKTIAA